MCESEEEHDRDREEAMQAFLADPGPPPSDWDADRIERAERGMARARAAK
jgi:hypothetical protein